MYFLGGFFYHELFIGILFFKDIIVKGGYVFKQQPSIFTSHLLHTAWF